MDRDYKQLNELVAIEEKYNRDLNELNNMLLYPMANDNHLKIKYDYLMQYKLKLKI
jgi:hypothetical protein